MNAKLADFDLSKLLENCQTHASTLARELISWGRIADLMDSSLGGRYKLSSAWKVAEVAYACVAEKSTHKPTMRMVVNDLEEAVTLEFQDSTQYERISAITIHESDIPIAR
ncbi:hypothetical protein SUGI_0683210 [Cryptomeria japonica]|nr:hypothetical protein SUGI_0683210 [Cryptomeria japonica]